MGWLDLIDLAIDVKQAADLRSAREQLRRIEMGAAEEALRQQIVEVLRNFVFSSAQQVKILETYLESSPQPVYVAATAFERRFQYAGISAEVFPEFTDKEYVQGVQGNLVRVIQNSRGRLTPGEISRAEECVDAIVQMHLLDQAIEAQSAWEQLQATEAEWKQASGRSMLLFVGGLIALGGSFIVCPVAWCFSTSMVTSIAREQSLNPVLSFATLAANGVLFLASMMGGIILLVRSRNPRLRELGEKRKQWRESIPDRETWEHIVSLFGQQNSQGYRRLQAKREAMIGEVMKQIEGYDKLLPPSSDDVH